MHADYKPEHVNALCFFVNFRGCRAGRLLTATKLNEYIVRDLLTAGQLKVAEFDATTLTYGIKTQTVS